MRSKPVRIVDRMVAITMVATATAALVGAARASSLSLAVQETQATHQWNGPSITMSAANLTTLGPADWAIFGWDNTTPVHVNSKAGANHISLPTVVLNGGNRQGRGVIVTSWTYSGGTAPVTAAGQNLGGLSTGINSSGGETVTFTVDVTGRPSGILTIWYAGVEGNFPLTLTLGNATATDAISEGYNTVRYKRVAVAFQNTGDTTISIQLKNTAQYSWTHSALLYAAAFEAPLPLSAGTAVMVR